MIIASALLVVIPYRQNQAKQSIESLQFIQDCKSAGGVPVYDLCAEKGFRLIYIEGYEWADEAYQYNHE